MLTFFRSSLYRQVVNLFLAQIAGFIIPLLQFPYIAKALDIKSLGIYVLSLATISIFGLIVEYGFNISATRRIAAEDDSRWPSIAASVQFSKLVLVLLSMPLFILFLYFSDLHNQDFLLISSIIVGILAQGFSPFWFFQGRLQTSFAVNIELISRLLVMAAIFVLIHKPSDLSLLILVQAIGGLFSTLAPTLYLYKQVDFLIPSSKEIKSTLAEGFSSFVYRASNSLQPNLIPAILSAIGGPIMVGLFGASDRISRAVIGMANPILQAFYPYISKLNATDSKSGHKFYVIALIAVLSIAIILSGFVFVFRNQVISLFLGDKYAIILQSILLICIIPPLVSANRVISQLYYLANGWERYLNKIFFGCQIVALTTTIPFAMYYGYVGALLGILTGETVLFILLIAGPKLFFKGLEDVNLSK